MLRIANATELREQIPIHVVFPVHDLSDSTMRLSVKLIKRMSLGRKDACISPIWSFKKRKYSVGNNKNAVQDQGSIDDVILRTCWE